MKLILSVNPVGQAHDVLDNKINDLKSQWDTQKVPASWWSKIKPNLTPVVSFLIGCIDDLILHISDFVLPGEDKKATVLRAISILYDYTAREAIPIWLRPFAGKVKNVVIYTIISYVIDFMVNKYKEGLWRKNEITEKSN
jgi:hypothetical protein